MTTQALNEITADAVAQFKFLNEHSGEFNSLDRYQEIATQSAIYPGQGTPLGLAYVALKLNGESGEFAEHTVKAFRDDGLSPFMPFIEALLWAGGSEDFQPGGAAREGWEKICAPLIAKYIRSDDMLNPDRHDKLVKEGGDILWYLAAIANELGISLSEMAVANLEKLQSRSERGVLRGEGDNR